MQNEPIDLELSDSDTDTDSKIVRPVEESTEISHHTITTSKVATLKAKLAAQRKLVAELGKEYNKLRKENKQLKNEQDIHTARMTGIFDRLDNVMRQLSDATFKVLDFASDLSLPKDGRPNVASSQPRIPNASDSGFTAFNPEPEGAKMAVVIESEFEPEPDLNVHVTFVKNEDGKFDIWNLEHLRLGPPISVEQKFHVGFRRAVISDALGGRWHDTFVNWQGPTSKSDRYPYMALKRSWNPYLPLVPGDHGVVFSGVRQFKDGTLITGSVDIIVSDKPDEWVYFGSYETSRSGEITPHQLHLLPPLVVQTWVEGILKSQWGKNWVEDTNAKLVDKGGEIRLVKHTTHGLWEALNDGRLVIDFTVMKCVGFRAEWFDQFLHCQAHAKLPTTRKRKKGSSVAKNPTAKRVKGSARRKEVLSESDSDEELQVTPPGTDEDEFSDTEDGINQARVQPLWTRGRAVAFQQNQLEQQL